MYANRDRANRPTAATQADRLRMRRVIRPVPAWSYTLADFVRHAAVAVAVALIVYAVIH